MKIFGLNILTDDQLKAKVKEQVFANIPVDEDTRKFIKQAVHWARISGYIEVVKVLEEKHSPMLIKVTPNTYGFIKHAAMDTLHLAEIIRRMGLNHD